MDNIDGCEIDFNDYPISDEEIPMIALFSDIDTTNVDQVEKRRNEWKVLLDAS